MSIETDLAEIRNCIQVITQILTTNFSKPATSVISPTEGKPAPTPVTSAPPTLASSTPPPPVPPGPQTIVAPVNLPETPGPVGGPAVGTPGITLDSLRDRANTFWRQDPSRAGEIMVILGEMGVTKVDDVTPDKFELFDERLTKLGV